MLTVVVVGATTSRVGLAGWPTVPVVKVPPVQPALPEPALGAVACIVNEAGPVGVVPLVVRVNVEVPVPPVRVTGLGLNDGVTPVGRVVVILSVALQLPLPFESKVIKYVAKLP